MAVNLKALNAVDRFALAYNAVIVALVLLFRSRVPQWPLQALLNVAMTAVVLLVVFAVRDRSAPLARLVRNLYPMALFPFLYKQTGSINHIVFPGFFDASIWRLEENIFGFQPAIAFAREFPQMWFAEYMYFAYWTYYLLFPGLGFFLCLRRTRMALLDYMFSLSGVMYFCFLIFIFLPVRDPSFEVGYAPGIGPFAGIMSLIYDHFEIEGGALPSSHVAVAAVVLYYTFRYARRGLWVVCPLVVSLMAATVYCRYHYAIDVLAGLAVAMIFIPLCRRINPDLRRKSPPD